MPYVFRPVRNIRSGRFSSINYNAAVIDRRPVRTRTIFFANFFLFLFEFVSKLRDTVLPRDSRYVRGSVSVYMCMSMCVRACVRMFVDLCVCDIYSSSASARKRLKKRGKNSLSN